MLRKTVGSLMLLAGVYASAGENYFQTAWDAKGLLALEGAFGQAKSKQVQDVPGGSYVLHSKTDTIGAGGLKLGGESEDYRLFLSGRFHAVPDYDSVTTLGLEMQYLMRAGENFNVFLGINAGSMWSQLTAGSTEYSTRSTYAGGDAGVNIDITQNFGVELGARLNKSLSNSDNPASIDYLAEAYMSLVLKFTGAY